ncbi:MAG: nucleotidyltransferase domain-containing protein [Myxococcales bacterium]|nr:nucleotidyltransferase domain-containing protein [Myxococcales bacterium]
MERETRDALLGWQPPLLAAWLFGSVARGAARERSDVDVAILTGRPRPRTLDELPLDLESALAARLGRPVEVVILDHAPVDLVHRVLRDGKLLLDRARAERIRFEIAARNRYFDLLPILREYRRTVEAP